LATEYRPGPYIGGAAERPRVGRGVGHVQRRPVHGHAAEPTEDGAVVYVEYSAPSYYCQATGDWPPRYTCTNDPLIGSSDHLVLWLGTPGSPIAAIRPWRR